MRCKMWQVAEIPSYRGLTVDAYHTGIKIQLDEALLLIWY